MPFTLAYLKASDALTPGNRFYSDHPSVSDYQLKEFTGSTRVVYSDQMAKNEQLNFYVNYEGSLASIALRHGCSGKNAGLYAFQADVA